MQKIKSFIVSNFSEIVTVFSLFIVFFIFMRPFILHFGSVIIDGGREAYFPEQILKGKILYKDIFNIFGPLSYQINAVFYKFFGISLSTLRVAGSLNALAILFLLYALARQFTSIGVSFALTVFIMISCCFSPWICNYIFPYTFSMVYAFSAFLFSVLFLIIYFKTSKPNFIPLSWFFIGFASTSKYEYFIYTIFLIILTLILLINKKLAIKHILYSIIAFLITPFISFSILFSQGLTLNEFMNQVQLIKKFALSPSLNYFYWTVAGLYPKMSSLGTVLLSFINVFTSLIVCLVSTYFVLKFAKLNFKNFCKCILSSIFAIISFYFLYNSIDNGVTLSFAWLPMFTALIFVYALCKAVKYKNNVKEWTFLLFLFIALIASAKTFFRLSFLVYGTFTFPLLFMTDVIFLVEYLPIYFKNINKNILKKAFIIVTLVLALPFLKDLIQRFDSDGLLSSQRGNIYNFQNITKPAQKVVNYINSNLNPTESIWIIPEGIMINFMTDRPSNGFYYNITPPYIDTFGEKKIISDTRKSPPDYIIINTRDTVDYKYKYLCIDYGLKICNYVKSSYKHLISFSDVFGQYHFDMAIYKRK